MIPIPCNNKYVDKQISRVLRLNCLTIDYKKLWELTFNNDMLFDGFTKKDKRLSSWINLSPVWKRDCALRTAYERRQALLELDTLAALALGLTIEELLTIYRIQFPVLQQYEKTNRYDQNGRLVPGEVLKIAEKEGMDITKPGNSIKYTDPKMYPLMEREYVTPFDTCDREEDMKGAWEHFGGLNQDFQD